MPINLERKLKDLQAAPELLIPPRLLEVVTDPTRIIARTFLINLNTRFDEDYYPQLAILIAERESGETHSTADMRDKWFEVMNHHHKLAIKQKKLSPQDLPLISLLADPIFNGGLEMLAYIQATHLKRQGIGTSFYDNLEGILKDLGYQYLFGVHEEENLRFFTKRGRILLKDVRPEKTSLLTGVRYPSGFTTFRFLNPALQTEVVRVN